MRKWMAALLVCAVAFGLVACEKGNSSTRSKRKPQKETTTQEEETIPFGEAIGGYAGYDGNYYIPGSTGNVIVKSVGQGYALEEAWMAPGDQTIVSVQQKMGQSPCLCVTGSDQAEIRELGSVSAVLAVRGDGILYLDGDGMLWRYFYKDAEPISAMSVAVEPMDVVVAEHTLSCGFATGYDYSADKLYLWPQTAASPEQIGKFKDTEVWQVSDDGKTLFWIGEGDALFMHRDGKSVTIASFASGVSGWESVDGQIHIVSNYDSGSFFIWRRGGKMEQVEMGASGVWHGFATQEGPLNQCAGKDVEVLYALMNTTLYAINQENECKVLEENISQFSIYGERMVYLQSGRLFCATLENDEIQDPLQVAVDVKEYLTIDNDKIYYVKDEGFWSNTPFALYKMDYDQKEPSQIAYRAADYHMDPWTGSFYYIDKAYHDDLEIQLWDVTVEQKNKELYIHDSYEWKVYSGFPWQAAAE